MTSTQWPEPFEQILRAFLPQLGQETPLKNDLRLAEHGLDSLATVSLLVEVEDAFGISIPDEFLVPDTFATPSGLWAVVEGLSQQP
ncbi:acyl carrier protein [Nonomuraea sp. SMC257]|uniref:Acyl carrier protein n=1 Tax=Nonomuraea montanisoli TaxID=2741721 RepID=A0A7Y6IAL6_9ACTN|nr:phosphopantetheine-binding protein [Nonomuraea montanisoli]NUW34551.1 acyl carrier protein [Nonomuraea montanisoli]